MQIMGFWDGAILGIVVVSLKRMFLYAASHLGEPLTWIILSILIGLIIFGIIEEIREKKGTKKDNLSKPKVAKNSSDNQVICHYCNGYGVLVAKDKGTDKSTTCPHCLGTGWVDE